MKEDYRDLEPIPGNGNDFITDASGSAISIHDLKCGNILNYATAEGEILPTVIDWQHLKWLTEDPKGFNLVHSGIRLTEEIMLKFRRNQSPDFQPVEFQKVPPGERQIENNFWSNWVNDDYRFHLSPSYGYDWINDKAVKSNKTEFWFCWYSSQGQWFLPIKNIRGKNRLQYVHQLQNLFCQLSGFGLVLR